MEVAVVWNHASRLLDCSFRFEQYVEGLRALGHEPVVVATRWSAEGFDAPFHLADDATAFDDPDFWRGVGAEVAVIVTWHRMARVLEAIRAAGTRVAAISDSDGRVGVRAHPGFALERLLVYGDGAVARLRIFKYWLTRYLRERRRLGDEDAEAVASTRASDAVAIGHGEGVRLFRGCLEQWGAGELAERVVEVPFTIGASFFSCEVPEVKDDRVAAVGRWDDPQKNAPLLAAALRHFQAARPGTGVEIFGAGGEDIFRSLGPRVAVRGVAPQEVVAETLSRCRSVIFSSRWEGCPHAACEALALGATVVGTPIPSLVSWTEQGRFGRVAERSRAGALAAALEREMVAWDTGERDARTVARHWRPRLEPAEVCRRLLAAASGPQR